MIPIHKLLSRIQWDRKFGTGNFEIGYYDRIENEIIRVSFNEIVFSPEKRDVIQVMDHEGVIHSIPLHRIRKVYKNNELIWNRPNRNEKKTKKQ